MSDERDTKFAGFAKALWDEVLSKNPSGSLYDGICLILARRAYDLVGHAIDNVDSYLLDLSWSNEDVVSYIPDLPELPEEEQS